MRNCICIFVIILHHVADAQPKWANYYYIDHSVLAIDASSPAALAEKLVAPYKTNLEKTRAIFSWVAQKIGYGQKLTQPVHTGEVMAETVNDDSSSVLVPMNELVADEVLKKRTALCTGYARLFKCLCDHAGIRCEIINGYGRSDYNRIGTNFRTNHTWNAVELDSSWYLVDVTWASGYFTYTSNQFIQRFDDQYFLSPPIQFALDHFPDDLRWSLLQQPPTPDEFQHSPYKGRCFVKYNIVSYWPLPGVIRASIGDTINLAVETNLDSNRNIGGGSLEDTLQLATVSRAVYCKPLPIVRNNMIYYQYVIDSPDAEWLQLVYNDDMILTYKLDIGKLKKN